MIIRPNMCPESVSSCAGEIAARRARKVAYMPVHLGCRTCPPATSRARGRRNTHPRITRDGWGDLTWVVTGGNGLVGGQSAYRHADGGVALWCKDLTWSTNREGLPFQSVFDFGEWLSDYATGHACAANAATGRAPRTSSAGSRQVPSRHDNALQGLEGRVSALLRRPG